MSQTQFNATELINSYINSYIDKEYISEENEREYLRSTTDSPDEFFKEDEEHSDSDDEQIIKKINFEQTLLLIIDQFKSILPHDYAEESADESDEFTGKIAKYLDYFLELKMASYANKDGDNVEIYWEMLNNTIKEMDPEIKSYIEWDDIFHTAFSK
jgi:hypothetical protein